MVSNKSGGELGNSFVSHAVRSLILLTEGECKNAMVVRRRTQSEVMVGERRREANAGKW